MESQNRPFEAPLFAFLQPIFLLSDRRRTPCLLRHAPIDALQRGLSGMSPLVSSDESSVEVIEVLDPCHPLYGRMFRVIRRVDRGSGNFSPSYEVEYLQNHSLLVPISVTEAYNKKANQTKLSIEALRDLVLAVECLESHEHGSEGSVGSAAASSAASDCRGCRRGSGGGLS